MNGIHLLMLLLLFFGIMPNLGFFNTSAFFILVLFFLSLMFFFIRKNKFPPVSINNDLISLIIMIYAALYYGGLYQPSPMRSFGQAIFFIMIIYLFVVKFMLKRPLSLWVIVLFFLFLSWWTLTTSPHPLVDTVIVFKEAPLKLLRGINPYNTTYSRVYQNITPNYYNHLPLSFIFYLPFAVLPIDERLALVLLTIVTFLLLYKMTDKRNRQDALLSLCLILFMPGSFYMLEHMYHDIIIFFFFVIAVYFCAKSSNKYYFFLACFFSIKQNMFIHLPFFIKKKLFERKNLLFFLLPFVLIVVFFIWNPTAFINNTVTGLSPDKVTAPIDMSLTIPTFISSLIPLSLKAKQYVNMSTLLLFVALYLFLLNNTHVSVSRKIIIITFSSYFFSYYGFFNSYYLVGLFLLYDSIKENFFNNALKKQAP